MFNQEHHQFALGIIRFGEIRKDSTPDICFKAAGLAGKRRAGMEAEVLAAIHVSPHGRKARLARKQTPPGESWVQAEAVSRQLLVILRGAGKTGWKKHPGTLRVDYFGKHEHQIAFHGTQDQAPVGVAHCRNPAYCHRTPSWEHQASVVLVSAGVSLIRPASADIRPRCWSPDPRALTWRVNGEETRAANVRHGAGRTRKPARPEGCPAMRPDRWPVERIANLVPYQPHLFFLRR
jgi:uncharacterized protein YwbE